MADVELRGERQVVEAELPAPEVSVVVTLYNEAASLEELYRRTIAALEPGPYTFEVIFVDDGSTDGTFAALERLHRADTRVRAVRFKRNFGQHPAMHAGLSRARGEIVVTMDGDLQTSRVSWKRSKRGTTSPAADAVRVRIRSAAPCRHT